MKARTPTILAPLRSALAPAALLLLAGCAPGPDFVAPPAPAVSAYTRAAPAPTASTATATGAAQDFATVDALPPAWWHLFHSPALNHLVRQALHNSPGLSQSAAVLRESQASLAADLDSAFYPSVTGNLSAERVRTSPAVFGIPDAKPNEFNLYNASVNVTYALDTSGGARRALEALRAQVRYQRYELMAARLALTANVITTAIQMASVQSQMDATARVLAADRRALDIVRQQAALGGASRLDVLTEEATVAAARASLPGLSAAHARARHALAVLTGQFPATAVLPRLVLTDLHLPSRVPVTLPSSLVRQRPDVRAARALLHVASADVGIAAAARLPTLNLTANYGSEATSVGALFSAPTMIWNAAAGLVTPLFNGGALAAKHSGAEAAYDAAQAYYQEAVLTAFQNVADSLRALQFDAEALSAQHAAAQAAGASLALTRAQMRFGASSLLVLLAAERQSQQAEVALVQARAARLADTAALFQALGGGWWAAAHHDRGPAHPQPVTLRNRTP